MQRYEIMKRLGDGTYGSVWMGKNKENGELVSSNFEKRLMVFCCLLQQ
jgi:serine/threonine protein kinase